MTTKTKTDRIERMLSSLHAEAKNLMIEIENTINDFPASAENGATWGTVIDLARVCDELEAIKDMLTR